MSNLFTQPWSNSEKIVLLTNIIQGAGNDVPLYLLQSILDNNIQPKWPDIALPEGRSLHACQQFYDDMLRTFRQPRSFSALPPTGYVQQPLLGAQAPPTRAVSEHEFNPPTQRAIQPRPPRQADSPMPVATNGEAFTILRPFAPELGVERRRKRGRPTKEEAEERDRRLAATGQTYEPKKRPTKKARPSETPHSLPEAFTTTSPGLDTPLLQRLEPQEGTSSGRKRRRPPDDDDFPQQPPPKSPPEDSGNERSIDVAQSPSDRLLHRSNERAQAVFAVARDIQQQEQSPQFKQEGEQRLEEHSTGAPSV